MGTVTEPRRSGDLKGFKERDPQKTWALGHEVFLECRSVFYDSTASDGLKDIPPKFHTTLHKRSLSAMNKNTGNLFSLISRSFMGTAFCFFMTACPLNPSPSLEEYSLLSKAPPPTVQIKLQEKQLAKWSSKNSPVQEVWALFTYGGWADRGQVWVTRDQKNSYF
mgnify:CR=1 FL=1